jgi:hypothetical protein
MCWVALDRALRLAEKRSFPADRARWLKARDAIYEEVMYKGWDPERRSFVQAYGAPALDASNLLMPLVFFTAPNDPRMLATVDAIRKPLSQGGLAAGGLVYRYDPREAPDGLSGTEGTFNMCSFWLVEALTRAGRTDRRRLEGRGSCSRRCWGTPTTWGCTPSRPARAGRRWGTSRKRSPTCPSSAPRSTWTGRWASGGPADAGGGPDSRTRRITPTRLKQWGKRIER